jgi:MFS transporter, PPP family, 3-phenylpropionic acid transporter
MRWLRALYVSNGLAVGSLYAFVPVLLQSKGFDPFLVGLTTSLGSTAYTLALPAWGHVGDVISGPRRALQLACIPAAVFALGLAAPLPVLAIIVCQMVLSAGGGPAMALTDAMTVPGLADPEREYARLRLLSSFGAAGGSMVFGLLYAITGYLAAPVVYLGVMAATFVSAQFVSLGRDSERHRRNRGVAENRPLDAPVRGRFGSVGEAFTVSPRLVAVLASVTLIFVGVMAAGTYMSIRISDLGGGPAEVGFTNGIGMASEIPGMIIAGWLISRVGARPVLAVSAVGFAACMASWIVIADAVPIMATRFISGFFFSGIFVSFVLTISIMLPARLQSTGMTLFQAGCFGLGAILANLLGGILYQLAGPLGVFGGGAICCIAGGLIGVFALPTRRPTEAEEAEPTALVPMSLAG